MRQQVFEERADIDWFFSTHAPAFMGKHSAKCIVLVLYGNEDAPEKAECFDVNDYRAAPYLVLVQNEQGRLALDESGTVPNLDALSANELRAFWFKHQQGRNYREIFPNGGAGTKRAAADLANYASNKATAQECRLRGNIETAQMYENIADRIYAKLPDVAKW